MARPNTIFKYGRHFPSSVHPVYLELKCLRYYGEGSWTQENGLLTKDEHFKNIIKLLWSESGIGKSRFVIHPWCEDMIHESLENDYIALMGAASTGKSEFLACFGLVWWFLSPLDSMTLFTSSSISAARKRCWGSLQRLFQSVPKGLFPGVLRDAPDPAVRVTYNGQKFDQAGCYLIPSDAKLANQSTTKLLGMKSSRLLLCADEMEDLSPTLIDVALANLKANRTFKCIAASNPLSRFSPFGRYCLPKNGWNSVNVETEKYELALGGTAIHLDNLKNPNYLAGQDLWPIASCKSVEDAIRTMHRDSVQFMRFWRGWIPDAIGEMNIWGESDILKWKADTRAIWSAERTRIGALDPAFVTGGDRCIVYYGWLGKDINGVKTIEFDKYFQITEDATNKVEPRNVQIVRKLLKLNEQEGCELKNFAVDSTGGGTPFCDILALEANSSDFYRVGFGGSASDLPISEIDKTPANEKYGNRVTEIWFSGLHYLRAGQLRGIIPDLASELCMRRYEERGRKMWAESKADMKIRMGKSCDIADAAMILLALCREKLGATQKPQLSKSKNSTWKQFSRKYDVVSLSPNAEFVDGSEINSLDNFM